MSDRIFVIGFIGSDRKKEALRLAAEQGYTHFDIDEMIEEKEGMPIKKLCMSRGEHEYRNKEVEMLRLLSEKDRIVVSCGDGIVLDEDSVAVLRENKVVFVQDTLENLWGVAKRDTAAPHAFLFSDEALGYKKFRALYEIRKPLYNCLAENS